MGSPEWLRFTVLEPGGIPRVAFQLPRPRFPWNIKGEIRQTGIRKKIAHCEVLLGSSRPFWEVGSPPKTLTVHQTATPNIYI